MATVDVFTAARSAEIEAQAIVSGHVVGDNLMLTKNNGTEVNAGNVRGANATAGARWVNSTAYVVGNTVGYAARVWSCIQANTGKVPGFSSGYWVPVNGAGVDTWSQSDPYFMSDTLNEWETFWTAGSITRSYGTAAGEFETGEKSLKIAMGTSSSQRLYEKLENVVNGGEKVQIAVRAKLLAAATGATLDAQLLQAPSTGSPVPFGSGASSIVSAEGSKTLTTAWQTFTFTLTTIVGKPRTTANVIFSQSAAGTSTILVDSIRVIRGTEVAQNQRLDVVESRATAVEGRTTATEARLDYHDGLVKGIDLDSVTNLNNLVTPGLWFQAANARATSALNYPIAIAGSLEVMTSLDASTTEVIQRYTVYNPDVAQAGGIFHRRRYNGTWFPWVTTYGDTGWVPLTLANSWVKYASAPYAIPAYRLRNGVMYTRGLISSGTTTAGTVMASFPAAYAPPFTHMSPTLSNSVLARVDVLSTAQITAQAGVASAWCSLHLVPWPIELP